MLPSIDLHGASHTSAMFARRLPFRRRRSHDRDLCREGPHCATAPPPPRKRKSFVSRVWAKEVPASITVLAVTVLLPVVTFLSAYRITDRVSQGAQWEEKGYFLSAMIDLQPAANIGSLGLTLSLGSFLVVAFVRHKIVKKQLGAQRCVLLHRASITLAFIAAIGGDGVAAYQHSASRTVHNIFAATFVLCALAHFCLECFIEWRGALSSFGVRLFHTAMCAVMAAGCATFLSHVLFEELGGTPIGIGKLLAAKAEIATVSAFVLYLCTYLETFRYAQIHFSISLRDNLGRSMSGVLLNEYGDDGAPTPLPIHES